MPSDTEGGLRDPASYDSLSWSPPMWSPPRGFRRPPPRRGAGDEALPGVPEHARRSGPAGGIDGAVVAGNVPEPCGRRRAGQGRHNDPSGDASGPRPRPQVAGSLGGRVAAARDGARLRGTARARGDLRVRLADAPLPADADARDRGGPLRAVPGRVGAGAQPDAVGRPVEFFRWRG